MSNYYRGEFLGDGGDTTLREVFLVRLALMYPEVIQDLSRGVTPLVLEAIRFDSADEEANDSVGPHRAGCLGWLVEVVRTGRLSSQSAEAGPLCQRVFHELEDWSARWNLPDLWIRVAGLETAIEQALSEVESGLERSQLSAVALNENRDWLPDVVVSAHEANPPAQLFRVPPRRWQTLPFAASNRSLDHVLLDESSLRDLIEKRVGPPRFNMSETGWNPLLLDRREFSRSIRQRFDERLAQYCDELEHRLTRLGYKQSPKKRDRGKGRWQHVDWLLRSQVGGLSYRAIARSVGRERSPYDEKKIGEPVREFRQAIGLSRRKGPAPYLRREGPARETR